MYRKVINGVWLIVASPLASDLWFPAPEGEGLGVGTVLSSISFISFYLLLSPFISFL